ncbi:competence protein ComK [Jeotgalibacillus sp. R-1-5s-1]|uniref:competence protein ComK n=1 Tax=Jeotgalibacillus sp. R-1-5s-1 TaxID=2555897 RepID=UPI00141ACCC8|nr:competence protein ComK [Jeotgalibacillus sp. R-1-5s-1]
MEIRKMKLQKEAVMYTINAATMMLSPVIKEGALTGTVVYEKGSPPFEVDQTPISIIEHSCLYYFSTYEGRKTSSRILTQISHKPPIVIDPVTSVYFFSTHADSNPSNHWISLTHVIAVGSSNSSAEALVTLSGNVEIKLPLSRNAMHQQYLKAAVLSWKLTQNLDQIREKSEDSYKATQHQKRYLFVEYLNRIEQADAQEPVKPAEGGLEVSGERNVKRSNK